MNPVRQIVDFLWWNKGDRDEERQWQSSRSFPEVVERTYRKQRDFQRDAARLAAMGYRVAQVGHRDAATEGFAAVGRGTRMAVKDVTQLLHVRYEREGNTALAPGTELANAPD